MDFDIKIVAIDPSLTQSGWAIFTLNKPHVQSWGVLPSLSSSHPLSIRLKDLQARISILLESHEIGRQDYLVCEGPAPISLNPATSIKVEQVRGIFETVAREKGLTVPGRLNPRTIQNELLGIRGKQIPRKEVKRIAREQVTRIFPSIFKNSARISQDVVDAILVGLLAQSRILNSLKAKINPIDSFENLKSNIHSSRKTTRGRGMSWPESSIRKL